MLNIKFLVLFLQYASFALSKCDEKWQVKINSSIASININGSLVVKEGLVYPNGTFWQEGRNFVGCPCDFKNCLSHCTNLNHHVLTNQDLKRNIAHWNHIHHHGKEIDTKRKNESKTLEGVENVTMQILSQTYYIVEEPRYDENVFYVEIYPSAFSEFPAEEIADIGFNIFCIFSDQEKVALYMQIEAEDMDQSKVLAGCMFISVICLVLMLVAFFITGEMKFLHGRNIACQSLSLMISFSGLTLNHINIFELETFGCYATAFVTYYFLMSSFFWLNAMCFDLFWTLWYGNCRIIGGISKDNIYSLYAWILPAVFTFAVVLMTFFANEDSRWNTGIGAYSCFLVSITNEESTGSMMAFLVGPLLTLLLLNFCFFGMTIFKICKTQRDLKRTSNFNEDRSFKQKKFLMYIKLTAVMGGCWIMEFISFAVESDGGIWFIFDIINCLRGLWLLIFCVFLNDRLRSKLLGKLLCKNEPNESMTRNAPSNSSIHETQQTGQMGNGIVFSKLNDSFDYSNI